MPRKEKKQTRRGNNEGSIYQRKDGWWVGQVLYGYKPDGKPNRKAVLGKTREEVAAKVAKNTHEAFRGMRLSDPTKLNVGEYVFGWVMRFKRAKISERTLEWYIGIVKNHIESAFSDLPLQKLTTYHVQELLTGMKVERRFQNRTIQGVRDTLNQAMESAVNMELLLRNPVRGVKMPKESHDPEAENSKAIPIELRKRILDGVADDSVLKPILITLMFTGMRSGELLALTWERVDFLRGTISVQSAVTRKPEFDMAGKQIKQSSVVSAPKTRSSMRVIKAPAIVMDALRTWRDYIDEACPKHKDFVFCTNAGNMRKYAGLRSLYRRCLDRQGLSQEGLHLHNFRHTFATMLLENSANPRVVQRLLGHADIGTTLGTYSHVVQEVYNEVAEVLGDIYSNTMGGTYQPRVTGDNVVRLLKETVPDKVQKVV